MRARSSWIEQECESSPPLPGSFGQHHRFEPLEPLGQSVREHFVGFAREIAEGLTVSHDHGSVIERHGLRPPAQVRHDFAGSASAVA